MNRLALDWVDTALALEQERDELQRVFDVLLEAYSALAIAYDELHGERAYEAALAAYITHCVRVRFPEEEQRAV